MLEIVDIIDYGKAGNKINERKKSKVQENLKTGGEMNSRQQKCLPVHSLKALRKEKQEDISDTTKE